MANLGITNKESHSFIDKSISWFPDPELPPVSCVILSLVDHSIHSVHFIHCNESRVVHSLVLIALLHKTSSNFDWIFIDRLFFESECIVPFKSQVQSYVFQSIDSMALNEFRIVFIAFPVRVLVWKVLLIAFLGIWLMDLSKYASASRWVFFISDKTYFGRCYVFNIFVSVFHTMLLYRKSI